MKYQIPDSEVENLLSVYWQLLAEVESRTDPKKDVLNKLLVEGAYKVLIRAGIVDQKPRWISK